MSDQHSIPSAGEHASPLWCANDEPHGPHASPNEFGSTNHCTGRPATEHGRSAEHVYEMLARAVHGERDGAVIRVPVEDIRVLLDEAARLRDEHCGALVVIERAKAIYDQDDDVAIDAEMYEALSTAPADALRERDAALAESLAEKIRHKQHAERETCSKCDMTMTSDAMRDDHDCNCDGFNESPTGRETPADAVAAVVAAWRESKRTLNGTAIVQRALDRLADAYGEVVPDDRA